MRTFWKVVIGVVIVLVLAGIGFGIYRLVAYNVGGVAFGAFPRFGLERMPGLRHPFGRFDGMPGRALIGGRSLFPLGGVLLLCAALAVGVAGGAGLTALLMRRNSSDATAESGSSKSKK